MSSQDGQTMGYMVSVDEMIFQDEKALQRLEDHMVDHLREMIYQSDYTRADMEEPSFHVQGKPLYSYNEDGERGGLHVLYMVEIPVWP